MRGTETKTRADVGDETDKTSARRWSSFVFTFEMRKGRVEAELGFDAEDGRAFLESKEEQSLRAIDAVLMKIDTRCCWSRRKLTDDEASPDKAFVR